ncbi:hypothetical protein PHYPSEUDO_002855 [Phytophthora pseudosyringae]|uniref:PH domain-containing protein n=1 Tax=Phytophthora pseudosyringae TaxID=221518 RepID=A0A8T1VS74_9STRA|nr:hypothetical protein PHYPSEUDO_002855 [Phytophthora pseudosyringae]
MQPWSGGRRGRERSSSVVLLGKLSAIVRRGSVFQGDPEDARSSSSGGSSSSEDSGSEDKERVSDDKAQARPRHARRCSVGATPAMHSSMTMWDPSTSNGSGRSATQRLQFYPARPLVAAALARPLSHEELMRRAALEAQIGDFGAVHASFAPPMALPDEQEEKEEVAAVGRQNGGGQGEMDNNEQENLEEEERRAALSAEEDIEQDDVRRCGAFAHDEELLAFDAVNMPASVRTLMSRIKSESQLSESDVSVASATTESNQEDDDYDDDEEEDVARIDDVEGLELDNNERSGSEQEEISLLVERQLSPAEHRLLQRRQTRLLSCAAEQAALSAQDQLTSSVRRLVIELKDDSDQMSKPLAQSHGIRRKSMSAPTRRRAGSCPTAYDLGVQSPTDGSSLPTPPPISPVLVPHEVHAGKKHKKSAFLRIGPRVLETLHLRKKRKTYLFTDEELETIEGARWKIVELAFRFGGKHRSYLVQAINMFFPLLKYGRRGGAHATRLHCNCCGTLQWQHKRGGLSEAVDLAEVLQVLDGRLTAVFRKYASNSVLEACSFSVVFRGRTLDLETQSSSHRDWLVSALRTLVAYARRQRRIEHQAIAERMILPLDDELLLPSAPARNARLPSPLAASPNRRIDEATIMAAMPPNYKIRTVY